MSVTNEALATFASEIAREAGELVLPGFGNAGMPINKGDNGYATNFDLAAERHLTARINARFPDHAVLGEEGTVVTEDREYTWVLDPIDGTHNYMHGIPLFCVSIGVRQGDAYVAGVVYAPVMDDLFVAAQGSGATRNGTAMTCSTTHTMDAAFLALELSRAADTSYLTQLQWISGAVFRYRSLGSAALALAYTAAGVVDGYADLHRLCNEWDWAGGKVLVEAAGGVFQTLPGGTIIASNAVLAEPLAALIRRDK